MRKVASSVLLVVFQNVDEVSILEQMRDKIEKAILEERKDLKRAKEEFEKYDCHESMLMIDTHRHTIEVLEGLLD